MCVMFPFDHLHESCEMLERDRKFFMIIALVLNLHHMIFSLGHI